MEMNVRDDQKLVEIWLTNAEKITHGKRQGSICHDEQVAYRPLIIG